MRIKIAILDSDSAYLERLVSTFGARYADKLELYSFTDQAIALATIQKARIDVLLASDAFPVTSASVPKRCAFAYFVDATGVDSVNGEKAVCKFQKAEQIYKQIQSLYAEKAENISGIRLNGEGGNIIAFVSAAGGAGSSSLAAACALRFAKQRKRVLYLNLEKFGGAEPFFSAEGAFTLSNVIFSLKSKRSNIQMKLESHVRKDSRGVYFFANAGSALDLRELDSAEIIQLLNELRLSGSYETIVLDMDFSLDQACQNVLREANAIVMVSDGSELSNQKTYRAYAALEIMGQNQDVRLLDKMCLAYNMFSNKTCTTVPGVELRDIKGAPRFQHASTQEVITALSSLDIFDNILKAGGGVNV